MGKNAVVEIHILWNKSFPHATILTQGAKVISITSCEGGGGTQHADVKGTLNEVDMIKASTHLSMCIPYQPCTIWE